MKVLITGAGGYLGKRLVQAVLDKHHDVVCMTRKKHDAFKSLSWIFYDLNSVVLPPLPEDTDVVIHLAVDSIENPNEQRSACLLLKACADFGAKFIFISSQTARVDAPTAYGRTKWHIEQTVLAAGGWVVRPGQVYGGREEALFGRLIGIVRNMPLLPAFFPAPTIQPIHVDDLVKGLLTLIERDDVPSCALNLGSIEAISFRTFLATIARSRLYKQKAFIPCPSVVVSCFKNIAQLQQLKSLFNLHPMNTKDALALLNLPLRPLSSGMHKSGSDRRRRLLKEGRVLLQYVLKERPKDVLLRRYVRAIEAVRQGTLINLPKWTFQCPVLMACLDTSKLNATAPGLELIWRLNAATMLAETTPQGARKFMSDHACSKPYLSILDIARALIYEVAWRIVGVVFRPSIK
ncbi:MAG: sugar nucleotide-binding protein [Legionellaceae bacterium]|nr:sugar nucleotide-binding protein [Legionellaceae bacterium]